MSEAEKTLLDELRTHLRIAKAWDYERGKMSFIDGLLYSLNKISGKQYGFSGQEVFLYGPGWERLEIEE